MKKRILVVLTAVICLLVGACTSAEPITVDCGDFSITCLRGWTVSTPEGADDANRVASIYLPEKDNYTSSVTITTQQAKGLKAEDFNEAYAQSLVEASKESAGVEFTLEGVEHTTLGSRNAVVIRYSGVKDGHNVVVNEQLVPTDEQLYRFTYFCVNDSDTANLEDVMNSVIFK